MLAYARLMHYLIVMENIYAINAMRLVQSADEIKARLVGEFSAVHGLSVNEFFLLMHLANATGARLSRAELAKRMHVNASTITRMAAPMEKIGLLGREDDDRDARLSYVVLTDTGRNKLDEARETFARQSEYLFQDRWTKAELKQLSSLLNRLVVGSLSNLTAE